MPRARAVLSLMIAGSLALTLGACGTAPTPTPTPSPSVTPSGDGVLRIGTLIPTSGPFAFLGPAQVAGVEVAIREINETGGVGGVPVEVFHRDSGEAGNQIAEASLADLVAKGADVVVGPTSSAIAQRLLPAVLKAKVALISPAATLPELTTVEDAGYLFRTIPAYGMQGLALARELAGKKVALLYVDDSLGDSIAQTLAAGLEAEGGELVLAEGFAASTTDLTPVIAALKDAEPEAVVLSSAYTSFDLTKALIAQTLAAGYGAGKLWLTTQNTGDYNQAFPPGTLAGVNGIIDGVEPDDAFKARLKQSDPNLGSFRYSVEAYDATILAALAAIVAGDDAGRSIATSLADVSSGGIKCTSFGECIDVLKTQDDIDYDGLSGSLNLTPAGDVESGYYGVYAYDGDNKFVLQRGLTVG
jgi:ABC-type branched-subunit amino acid transport system substrate-binding protein